MIKSLIFDFGGTIDTNGIHWLEKFWSLYNKNLINISRELFIDAYIFAERRMNERINPDDSFKTTLENQVSLQFQFLAGNKIVNLDNSKIDYIVEESYSDVSDCISNFKENISGLEKRFSLAVVSNFYGNLKTVLEEFSLLNFFDVITDSADIKIRKPDPEIFLLTISELSVKPEETFVIGDSYENDIRPAKSIGCNTIWLLNRPYKESEEIILSDYMISSINQLRSILQHNYIEQ